MKRKPTQSAELSYAQLAELARGRQGGPSHMQAHAGNSENQGDNNDEDYSDDTNDEDSEDDDEDSEDDNEDDEDVVPPPSTSKSQFKPRSTSKPRSRSKRQRKTTKHLPHHHKLLSK
jgi:hypothetical protein